MAHSSSESLSFHNDSAGVPQLQCTMYNTFLCS